MKEYYCQVCGRKINGFKSTIYCGKHAQQLLKYGKTLDVNSRNKFDSNEFRFIGNTVEFDTYKVPTYDVDSTFIIDSEDYPLVSKYKWRTHSSGYATSGLKNIYLHRLIVNAKPGQQVDHINLNVKDNRKCNLRIANNSLNSTNRAPYNKLGVKGIEYHKKEGNYSAYLRVDYKQYHSNCYKTIPEAAFARYILEQMFINDYITQFSSDLIKELSEDQKITIIRDLKTKFNK